MGQQIEYTCRVNRAQYEKELFQCRLTVAITVSASLLCALTASSPLRAQITPADTAGINYPGWESADQVVPIITVQTSYNDASGLWTYRYTIRNAATARQAISNVMLALKGLLTPKDPLTAAAPPGWEALVFPYGYGDIGGAAFFALYPDDSLGPASGPPPARIQPGDSLSGFVVTSPYPPGYARSYVQGYVNLPTPADTTETYEPQDTVNSQRGTTLFPNEVIPLFATQAENRWQHVSRLVEVLAPPKWAAGLRNSAAIVIRFTTTARKPDHRGFRAFLNGVDVTKSFHAVPGGPIVVAAFSVGASPLNVGSNRLVVTIENASDSVKPERESAVIQLQARR